MKKADYEKERKFIEHFAITGNASESCVKAGYKKETSAQMGYYLKDKLRKDILETQTDIVFGLTGSAITKLTSLMNSESDAVCLNACKLILEMGGFQKATELNVNVRPSEHKSDEELITELKDILLEFPDLKEKIVS